MVDRSRRDFLRLSLALKAGLALGAGWPAAAAARGMRPTPSCGEGAGPTAPQTEGPYFKPESPLRASLVEPGTKGTPMTLAGRVLLTDCTPVARALVDFWHADDDGEYDLSGYRLRGHQLTDAEGRYTLETIVPGVYPGRTRHFHVKVQAPGGRVLTTQLYFPGEPANRRDRIFDPALVVALDGGDRRRARFDFVLAQTAAGRRGA